MPSDLPTTTSQFDEDGFPIAIGFQPSADQTSDIVSSEPEATAIGTASPDGQQEPLTGYELVEDMMRRQDVVLGQLDDLNARIESAIQEISAVRKSEMEALEAEADVGSGDEAFDGRKAA